MVSEERQLSLHGIGISRSSPDPSRDTPFRELETQLEKFAVNARGAAPRVGFSETIRKIKARTSLLAPFRPRTWLTLETHIQYKRNPARCQFTTVLGVTKMRLPPPGPERSQSNPDSLCRAGNRRRGCCACRASNAGGEPGSRGRGPPGNGKR